MHRTFSFGFLYIICYLLAFHISTPRAGRRRKARCARRSSITLHFLLPFVRSGRRRVFRGLRSAAEQTRGVSRGERPTAASRARGRAAVSTKSAPRGRLGRSAQKRSEVCTDLDLPAADSTSFRGAIGMFWLAPKLFLLKIAFRLGEKLPLSSP